MPNILLEENCYNNKIGNSRRAGFFWFLLQQVTFREGVNSGNFQTRITETFQADCAKTFARCQIPTPSWGQRDGQNQQFRHLTSHVAGASFVHHRVVEEQGFGLGFHPAQRHRDRFHTAHNDTNISNRKQRITHWKISASTTPPCKQDRTSSEELVQAAQVVTAATQST